jgi:hypothetical protein
MHHNLPSQAGDQGSDGDPIGDPAAAQIVYDSEQTEKNGDPSANHLFNSLPGFTSQGQASNRR